MKHARRDYESIQDLSGKIPDDEPVFLLRSKDKLAPIMLAIYMDLARANGADERFIELCGLWGNTMKRYAEEHYNGGKVPDVDPAFFVTTPLTEYPQFVKPDLTKPPGCICKDVVYMDEKCTAHPDHLKDEKMHKDLQGRSPTQEELEKLGGKSPTPSPAKPKLR